MINFSVRKSWSVPAASCFVKTCPLFSSFQREEWNLSLHSASVDPSNSLPRPGSAPPI